MMKQAVLAAEVKYMCGILARVEKQGTKTALVESVALDRLYDWFLEAIKQKTSDVWMAILQVLLILPAVDRILKHPIAKSVKNISVMDKKGANEAKDLASAVLKAWFKERQLITGKPSSSSTILPTSTARSSSTTIKPVAPKTAPKSTTKVPVAKPKMAPPAKSIAPPSFGGMSEVLSPPTKKAPVKTPGAATAAPPVGASSGGVVLSSKPAVKAVAPAAPSASSINPVKSMGGGTFASQFLSTGDDDLAMKKKKRIIPAAGAAAPAVPVSHPGLGGKKARIVTLDSEGKEMNLFNDSDKLMVDARASDVAMTAADILARKGGAVKAKAASTTTTSTFKTQTAAALAAKARDERNSMKRSMGDSDNDVVGRDVNPDLLFPSDVQPIGLNESVSSPPVETTTPAPPPAAASVASVTPAAPAKKRVTWASDENLVQVRNYVPENPNTMISTRAAIKQGIRIYKLDAQHEKEVTARRKEEEHAKEYAKRMEPTVSWKRPQELKIVYEGDDEPPKEGQSSTEAPRLKALEEGKLMMMYNDRNPPPDDPKEAADERDYDLTKVLEVAVEPLEDVTDAAAAPLLNILANPMLSAFLEKPPVATSTAPAPAPAPSTPAPPVPIAAPVAPLPIPTPVQHYAPPPVAFAPPSIYASNPMITTSSFPAPPPAHYYNPSPAPMYNTNPAPPPPSHYLSQPQSYSQPYSQPPPSYSQPAPAPAPGLTPAFSGLANAPQKKDAPAPSGLAASLFAFAGYTPGAKSSSSSGGSSSSSSSSSHSSSSSSYKSSSSGSSSSSSGKKSSRELCKYYGKPGGCKSGKSCKYSHEK